MAHKKIKYNECVQNTLILICKEVHLHYSRYILKKIQGKKLFDVPGKHLNTVNDETIKVIISVNVKDSEIFKKNEIISLNID